MNNMMDVFKSLLSTEAMVDVTLACDGLSLKAHKIVLSACSPFFQSLFLENPCKHPIVILKDMKYTELKAIIEFMYHGEVNVAQDQLSALMKTAETLRVKGLAEVTNEKQSNSDDTPSHRSVERPSRTETPPSKRRRGRTRKRSISDQSDDDVSEPKIKQPDSDIEELSGDMDNSSQYSSVPSTVPMQTVSSHNTNSFHKQSQQQQEQPLDHGADESYPQEEKFGVEPSKLLEQTLTTDDLPRRSGRSSVQSNMSNMEMQRRPRGSTDHSTSLVPTSMPSDALVVANQQPESPPDIKPELLELEPPMSPVAGPSSHSADENSMMMYMDQSSMSGMPGPSGYQDNSALVSSDSQPQGNYLSLNYKMLCVSRTKYYFVLVTHFFV